MTPSPPPSAEHFTQVVTEVDRLVQQGCAEISALSRMALLWLETPETSNRLEVLASALRTIRNSADMLASETSGEVVAVGCSHHVKKQRSPLNPAERSKGPHQPPVCQRLRRAAFFDLTFLGESRKGRRLPGRDPASKNNGPAGSKQARCSHDMATRAPPTTARVRLNPVHCNSANTTTTTA
ncbi:hypothetical protein ACF8OH_06880 [Delftia sp. WSY_9]|uniref:hypothetical protein n=1 Tax=unclassified Delftia TaxID=2613839 RepID=UPI00370B6A8B